MKDIQPIGYDYDKDQYDLQGDDPTDEEDWAGIGVLQHQSKLQGPGIDMGMYIYNNCNWASSHHALTHRIEKYFC